MSRRELLEGLVKEAEAIPLRDDGALDAFRRRADMLIRRTFGEGSHYLVDLQAIHFHPSAIFGGMEAKYYETAWRRGQQMAVNLTKTMLEEYDMLARRQEGKPGREGQTKCAEVFVVHGHNEEMKQSVARTIEKLGLKGVQGICGCTTLNQK